MSEVKKFITRYSRDYQGNLQEDPNGSWVLAADAAIRDKMLMGKIDALQQRLNAADQRNDDLSGLLQGLIDNPFRFNDAYRARIAVALNPTSETPDQLRDAAKMIGIERMPPMEYDEP